MGNKMSNNYRYDRAKFADPDYKADDYEVDERVRDGPLENRSCTDVLFCLIFLAFLGGLGVVSFFGYQHGKPERLLAPLDADGKFCGLDEGLQGHPYLYLLDVTSQGSDILGSAVCVSKCPMNDSQPVDCVPTSVEPDCNKLQYPWRYNTTLVFKKACLPILSDLNLEAVERYNEIVGGLGVNDIGQAIDDIMNSWPIYCIALVTTFIVTFIYLFLVRLFAGPIVWLSIIGGFIGIIGLGFYLNNYANTKYDDGSSTKSWIKAGSYTCWAFAGIFLLLVLCLFNNIKIATAVMKTSAVFISQNLRTIIIPIIAFILTVGFIVLWVIDAAYLSSSGEIISVTGGTQYRKLIWDDKLRYFMIYHLFALLWVAAMIISCTQFVIIVAVCVWYFTSTSDTRGKASLFKGVKWVFQYNFGSLALGSFLLALVWFVIIVFEYLNKKLNGNGNGLQNPVTKCASTACRCCLQCCHRFIKFLNRNAFVQVALHSKNFCTSAMNAFLLVLKNSATFFVSDGIGSLFIFLGKVFISVINTGGCYVGLINWKELNDKLNSPIPPMVAVFLISYIIASVFMALFSIAQNSLVQCFLTDVEISRGRGGDGTDGKHRPKELDHLVRSLTKKTA